MPNDDRQPQPHAEEEWKVNAESLSTTRSRAARNAVQQANAILAEQSRLQRQQSRVVYRTELFFALLSAGLAWNLWATRQNYNQCKEQTQLKLTHLKQERDALQYQLSNLCKSLENQLEPISEHLLSTAFSGTNKTTRQQRKEALYKWLEQAKSYPS